MMLMLMGAVGIEHLLMELIVVVHTRILPDTLNRSLVERMLHHSTAASSIAVRDILTCLLSRSTVVPRST